jgi:hypothetical protein
MEELVEALLVIQNDKLQLKFEYNQQLERLDDSFTSRNQSCDNPVTLQSEQHREPRDVLKEFMKAD